MRECACRHDKAPRRIFHRQLTVDRACTQRRSANVDAQVEVGKLRTDVTASSVDITGARENVYYAEEDLKRQQALMKDGFTTRARLQQSQQALDNARAGTLRLGADDLAAIDAAIAATLANMDG